MREAVAASQNTQLQHIVGLLLLTGARVRELLDARWETVDVDRQSWLIPTSKTGNPALSEEERSALLSDLGRARAAVKAARCSGDDLTKAGRAVDAAKVALGERGPVWWTDGAPDFNRHMAKNTSYADWYTVLVNGAGQQR